MKACRTFISKGAMRRALVCFVIMVWNGVAGGAPALQGVEGTVEFVRPVAGGGLEIEAVDGTNRVIVAVKNARGLSPALRSRIRAETSEAAGWGRIQIVNGLLRPLAMNVADLRHLGKKVETSDCVADLRGQVLAASRDGQSLVFADATGVILLELKPPGQLLTAGQELNIQGNCVVAGPRVIFRSPPVVNNDGVHGLLEKSGDIFLTAGRHALRLDWFNRQYPYGLGVYCTGPGLARQKIPDAALFLPETGSASGQHYRTNGLDYRCYEGSWLQLPDFGPLLPAREGRIANFETTVITRTNDVGLEFKGYLQVPRTGVYTFSTVSDDGSLLFIDETPPVIQVTGTAALPTPTPIEPQQSLSDGQEIGWSETEGTVTFAGRKAGRVELDLSSETGRMRVEFGDIAGAPPQLFLNNRIRVKGICLATRTMDGQGVAGILLSPGMNQVEVLKPEEANWNDYTALPSSDTNAESAGAFTNLTVLTKVQQIKRLTREQWQRGYPVKIRGVITTALKGGFFIQDPTWSIYARWHPPTDNDIPRVGDFWEVEGNTFAEFAPNIQVSRAVRLGFAALPEPLRPTWDQLINGSLDTEYVELQGIITAANSVGVTLLTRSGKIGLELPDLQPQALQEYVDALIRVRGCVIPVRDINTQVQQVDPKRIRLSNASITVDEAAPADPFAAPLKHAADLLLFDWQAGAFQRVKITGQILHIRDDEYFLTDEGRGLRFIPKTPVEMRPGDLAEAVGFVDLGQASPVLHEAVARRIGTAKLPDPVRLEPDALLGQRYDSTLVKVRARVNEIGRDPLDYTLQLQSGTRPFVARLRRDHGPLPALTPGSLLELTGVYAGQGGDAASRREITSFELLLNSGNDIRILAQPSWWTLRRALIGLGALAFVVLAALAWIAVLHRQVEERSQQLATEVRRHEQTDRRRELETERARIAQDLHDDLGAALTQIRFLSLLESRDTRASESARGRMEQISEKSRELVASLDEIVWAVNPTNDSLASLANYLCHYAEEFFSATPIRCRLDVADALPSALLTTEVRHHLYLSVREAMNNIAKHSNASEVWLRIRVLDGEARIELQDNGRGFKRAAASSNGEGLASMRQRLEKIGGRFECESQPGTGTVCLFALRVEAAAGEEAK